MRNVTFRIAIAFATFLIGVCATMFWVFDTRRAQPPSGTVSRKSGLDAVASDVPPPESGAGVIKKELTRAGATRRFEEFVAENGYTDLPPTEDASRLVPGLLELQSGDGGTEWVDHRRNTLERKPAQVTKGNRFFKDGWSAFFFRKQPCEYCSPGAGRLIYMDAGGEILRVEHMDVFLTKPKKRKKAG